MFLDRPVAVLGLLTSMSVACAGGGSTDDASQSSPDGGSHGDGGAATIKKRFVESNATAEETDDWDGSPIDIESEGVAISVNGGVKVTADPAATKVKAVARLIAMSFDDEKANADQSITDVRSTFRVSRVDGAIAVDCRHGRTHGSSIATESGCELVEVTLPAGSAAKPLDLAVRSGSGDVTLQIAAATIKNVTANNPGTIAAALPATQGARISLVAEHGNDVTARMPSSWAADEIVLEADADKIASSFPDATLGPGGGGRGEPGTGLASLKLASKEFAGNTGMIRLE